MVRRILGKEDTQWRNPFYQRAAPQRLFGRERVLAAEGSADFEAARAQSAARSARSRTIAERKMPDLNANDLDAASKIIAGTARSMGITVEG